MENPTKGVLQWGIGLAALALFGLIMLILFGNLSSSNLGLSSDTHSPTVSNESTGGINSTGYTLAVVNSSTSGYVLTDAWDINATGTLFHIGTGNVSVDANGLVTNSTAIATKFAPTGAFGSNATLTYRYVYTFQSQSQKDTSGYISNYTTSLSNTSTQFPTIGTILGVALLLAILIALLVYAVKRMGGIAGSGGSSGSLPGGDFA